MTDNILLMSGGIDSTVLAYQKDPDLAITVDYGQTPAEAEIEASQEICNEFDIEHKIIRYEGDRLGTGTMADEEQLKIASAPEWWPFRNQLIVTLAAIEAVKRDANELLLGTVKGDREHADGRPKFVELIDELVALQEGGLRVSAPAQELTSVELVSKAKIGLNILAWTHSCHVSNQACGTCRGCTKRQDVIDEVFK